MHRDLSESTEFLEMFEQLRLGENVILIGPNQGLIDRLLTFGKNELSKRNRVHWLRSIKGDQNSDVSSFECELNEARSEGATHIVADGISPKQGFCILTKHAHFTLLASMPMSHVLGVTVAWAALLQTEFGEKSRMAGHLLPEFLKTLRCVGVAISSVGNVAGGSFREKLLTARYNQGRPLGDHKSLLKGWTKEGDACDPGWELDR